MYGPRGGVIMVTGPHVPIPGSQVQFFIHAIMVKPIKPAHEIMRYPIAWLELWAQHIQLYPLEIYVVLGSKTFEFQHKARVMPANRDRDLLPGRISLAPIGS